MDKTRVNLVTSKTNDRLLKFHSRADISDCEAVIECLPTLQGPTRIKIATDWSLDSRPGGTAAAMQAVITWARSQDEPTLVTYATASAPANVLDRFCERAQGLCAIMMSANVVAVDGITSVRREAWRLVEKHVIAMDRMELSTVRRGQTISLVCVDHSSLGTLTPLYRKAGSGAQVKDASELSYLIDEIIPSVAPNHGRGLRNLSEDLGIILHELVSNTHHHGRIDVDGRFYKRSVRSVTLSERAVPIYKLNQHDEGWTGMKSYLEIVARSSRSKHNVRFIELSVVDSGPGMAAHAARAELDPHIALTEEHELVQKCFNKYETRRTKAGLGMGLSRVMNVVKAKGGLIRIRTGRLSLTRYFDPATADSASEPTEEEMKLLDSRTLSNKASPMGKVAGTSVSILIPVGLNI